MTNDTRCPLTHYNDPERPRSTSPGLPVCRGHYRKLEQMIAEAPSLDTELIKRHAGGGDTRLHDRVDGTKTPGINVRDDIASARANLRNTLARIAQAHAASRSLHAPSAARIGDVATFLTNQLAKMLADLDADGVVELYAELGETYRAARRAAYPPPRARRVEVGPCLEEYVVDDDTGEVADCPGVLVATVFPDDDPRTSVLVCSDCGAEYDSTRWYRLGLRLLAKLGRREVSA